MEHLHFSHLGVIVVAIAVVIVVIVVIVVVLIVAYILDEFFITNLLNGAFRLGNHSKICC